MSNDFAQQLAAEVRTRRRAERLTQLDLANLSGVSERFIRSLEHGKPTLRLESIMAVLETLGLEIAVIPWTGRNSLDEYGAEQ